MEVHQLQEELPSGKLESCWGNFAPLEMEPRNALLARRGAQILEEAAQLSSKRGSLEEQQQQKVLEAPALSIRIYAARCHGRCCLVGAEWV